MAPRHPHQVRHRWSPWQFAMLEADLSAGKGVLWLKSPQPDRDGTLVIARYMGQGKADFAAGADLFVHVVYGPGGDRCGDVAVAVS